MRSTRNRSVARRRFGQHFLEAAWVEKVVRAIDPRPDDTFIEIGPGRGALTRPLAMRADRVVAYEIDRDLAAALAEDAPANVAIVEGDFLEAIDRNPPFEARGSATIRVAANLPYNVASPILFKLIELYARGVRLGDATLMLQREVADRLLARTGTKDYGSMTVLIGHSAAVTRVLDLPPGAFRPAPKVRSTVVRLQFHPPDPPVRDSRAFETLVRAAFMWRRKTLANALAQAGSDPAAVPSALARAGIDGRRRAETLTIAEFATLADVLATRS